MDISKDRLYVGDQVVVNTTSSLLKKGDIGRVTDVHWRNVGISVGGLYYCVAYEDIDLVNRKLNTDKKSLIKSDGSTAAYYELPENAKELQHLISFKNMNAQMGEIFRSCYRYGEVEHSSKIRDIKKIIHYAKAELDRLELYEEDGLL